MDQPCDDRFAPDAAADPIKQFAECRKMIDPHQVNTIISTTICGFFAHHPDAKIGIEEAKLLAKQIAEALNEAGLQIAAADSRSATD